MPLPKPTTPIYELILPSTEKTIKYRPFLVKEEKILLLALETKDIKSITSAIKQILKECIITKGIKVEELPTFDIEYLFLNVRGKSVGEGIDLIVTCNDDGETQVPVTVFIDEIQVQKNPEHSTDIKLDDSLVLRMKYPSLDRFIKDNFDFSMEDTSMLDKSFDIITSCMDMVFNQEDTWSAKDCTKKELVEFIEGLNSQQFKQIDIFFQTMPKLSHTFTVVNPKTKKETEVTLEGLTSFFG
jgi:hypothetical protein